MQSFEFTVLLQVELLALMKSIKITFSCCQAAEPACAGRCAACGDAAMESVLWNRHRLPANSRQPRRSCTRWCCARHKTPSGAMVLGNLCHARQLEGREKALSDQSVSTNFREMQAILLILKSVEQRILKRQF